MAIVDSFYQHLATRTNTWLSNKFLGTKTYWAKKGQCIDHFLVHYTLKNAGIIMDGPYSGLLTENENGSLLKAFCHRNRMAIVDSFYQHQTTRKKTWLSNKFPKTKTYWAEKGQCIDHFLVHYTLRNAGIIMDMRVRANDLVPNQRPPPPDHVFGPSPSAPFRPSPPTLHENSYPCGSCTLEPGLEAMARGAGPRRPHFQGDLPS